MAAGAAGAGVLAASAGGSAAAAPGVPGLAAVTPAAPAARPAPPPAVPAPAAPAPATVVAAEAPTRYRAGGEPATSVRPRRRRRLRRVVLALVLVALAAAGGWAAYVYLLAPGATVPAVVGERRADATRALRDEGLKPELHFVWADRFAAGEVARQAPRGGAKVDDGVKVDLWVSRGPLHIPSPDLDRTGGERRPRTAAKRSRSTARAARPPRRPRPRARSSGSSRPPVRPWSVATPSPSG